MLVKEIPESIMVESFRTTDCPDVLYDVGVRLSRGLHSGVRLEGSDASGLRRKLYHYDRVVELNGKPVCE